MSDQRSEPNQDIYSRLVGLTRAHKQILMLSADIAILLLAVWGSYALRLGHAFIPNEKQVLLMAAAPALAIPVFIRIGLYRSVIRYVGEQALWTVMKGMTIAALLWSVLAFMTQMTGGSGVPRSVPFIYWLLGGVMVGGARFAARWLLWVPLRERYSGRQVLVYGAGDAGRQLVASLRQGQEFFPAGFIDDDRSLHGKDVAGLRVYAPNMLDRLIEQFQIHDVIVTLPSASAARRRAVVEFLEQHPVKVRILPAMTDLASGRHLVNMVREVDISDLLGRDPVTPMPELLSRCITDKVVMVTGAGGSIGSELCRQIARQRPAKLVLLDISEHALYQIERQLKMLCDVSLVASLGSVCDRALIGRILAGHGVHTIYHAAAYKHVPIVEANLVEGVRNNLTGTRVIAELALAAGVETFVLISTDKAVRPTSVMGATKRCAELVMMQCARLAQEKGLNQRFCAVRFGNVLGSSGSVIPLFKEQISRGGTVTVTHPDVTRYFMSVHEAVELVIQAGSMAKGGEIFLLDMGEPIKIVSLARNMIRLAGCTLRSAENPDGTIEIVYTGLRPGEKLYEELLIDSGSARGTLHPKIMQVEERAIPAEVFSEFLDRLEGAALMNEIGAREVLFRLAEGRDLEVFADNKASPDLRVVARSSSLVK